jgi:hypothetical protein
MMEKPDIQLYTSGISEIPGMRITKNFGLVNGISHDGLRATALEKFNGEANAIINVREIMGFVAGDAVTLQNEPLPSIIP